MIEERETVNGARRERYIYIYISRVFLRMVGVGTGRWKA